MKITKDGVWFKKLGYQVLAIFPWKWKVVDSRLYSPNLRCCYDTFRSLTEDLVKLSKKQGPKIEGLGYEDIIADWVSVYKPFGAYIVLSDVNAGGKPVNFWSKIPKSSWQQLIRDVVVLEMPDVGKMKEVLEGIPRDFAKAQCFNNGIQILDNEEEDEGM